MCRSTCISPPVSVRFLLGLLIAMAMAFAPIAMPLGEAAAAQPSPHGDMAGMTKGDHCPDQPQPQQHHKAEKSCCVAGCFALATLSEPETAGDGLVSSLERPAPEYFRRSILNEIATPPPRHS